MAMKCPKCDFENPTNTRFCGNCATPLYYPDDVSASRTRTYETLPDDLTTGKTFAGRYEIIEELGSGGMGKVYKVFDREIEEKIALKLLKPEIAAREKTIKRFRNELKYARKISHKNVCRMFDLNREEGKYFITMEYVPGEDLKNVIRMMGRLSVGKAVVIARQMCEGLREAHKLGVVHRDLKPQNVMIDRDGDARIMDFGIAQSLEAEGITDTGVMIGTPKYMSPEQVAGKKIDHRSDIYSLGIILYEMLTGEVPFDGITALDIALKQKTEEPREPRELNAQIPVELSRVILKCLEKNKELRYQSIEEVHSDLLEIEEQIPTKEKIRAEMESDSVTLRKRLRVSSFLLILLFSLVILVGGYLLIKKPLALKKASLETVGDSGWINSIAVLPFRDFSANKDQEHICFGVMNAIIGKLGQIQELKVISTTSALRFKDSDKVIKDIGSELEVANILEGSIQTEENRLLLTAQLTKVNDNTIIWSGNFDRQRESLIDMQDEISQSIAEVLIERLSPEKITALKTSPMINAEAYEYFEWGNFHEKEYFNDSREEDFEAAVKMYEKAIEIEPEYALAFWGLGNVYESRYNKTEESEERDDDRMIANYKRAYEIDPNLAETNLGIGWVSFYQNDFDRAYQYYRRALEISPNNASINFNTGSFFYSVGLPDQAKKFYAKAIDLDPLRGDIPSYRLMAKCELYTGKFEEAEKHLKKALELEPSDFRVNLQYASLLIVMKRFNEALRVIERIEEITPDTPMTRHFRAWIHAAKGEREQALALMEGIIPYSSPAISIYSLLGMRDEAIKNIKVGIDEGFDRHKTYLYSYPELISNPYFDNLRDDPRFMEIVKQEKEKYKEKLRKYTK
jgi:tetratricopeptide (TPR) repeat protein